MGLMVGYGIVVVVRVVGFCALVTLAVVVGLVGSWLGWWGGLRGVVCWILGIGLRI